MIGVSTLIEGMFTSQLLNNQIIAACVCPSLQLKKQSGKCLPLGELSNDTLQLVKQRQSVKR